MPEGSKVPTQVFLFGAGLDEAIFESISLTERLLSGSFDVNGFVELLEVVLIGLAGFSFGDVSKEFALCSGDARVRLSLHDPRKAVLEVLNFPLHARIPVVLDVVVGAAGQRLGDVCPAVAEKLVVQEQEPVFVFGPRRLFDVRIEVVVPPLAALLSFAPGQVVCDRGPLFGAQLGDELHKQNVLFFAPRLCGNPIVLFFAFDTLWEFVNSAHLALTSSTEWVSVSGAYREVGGDFLPAFQPWVPGVVCQKPLLVSPGLLLLSSKLIRACGAPEPRGRSPFACPGSRPPAVCSYRFCYCPSFV